MGMVVRTNVMAMNANRQLGVNNSQVAKSLEKLSSGFKINRAADDASGLAISEKMKAQIKGLETASANSQDGISLIQTAEGAATEIHDMLNRMVELATKSSNGTIQNEVDREAIQREVDDLNSEISRIAQSTNFNGINLLDGNLSGGGNATASVTKGAKVEVSPLISDAIAVSEATKGKYTLTLAAATKDGQYTVSYKDEKGALQSITVDVANTKGGTEIAAALNKTGLADLFDITSTGATNLTFEAKTAGTSGGQILLGENAALAAGNASAAAGVSTAAKDAYMTLDTTKLTAYAADGSVDIGKSSFTVNGQKFALAADAAAKTKLEAMGYTTIATGAGPAADDAVDLAAAINVKLGGAPAEVDGTTNTQINFKVQKNAANTTGGGLTLQVGDTNDSFNKVTVSVDDLSASGIGTNGLNVSTQDAAGNSIATIKAAINKVSTNRANLGSLQNRLEHTINNLDTTAENMSAANSRIRDTDMAKEMMNYTKMNVLVQSAQAMLAQANQQPQSILQLLQ